MKLIYKGPSDAVVVPLPDGRELECEHGKESPDFPADVARSLLEQKNVWKDAREPDAKPEPAYPAGVVPTPPAGEPDDADAKPGPSKRKPRGGVSNGS